MDAVPTARREAKKVGNIDDIMAEGRVLIFSLFDMEISKKQLV